MRLFDARDHCGYCNAREPATEAAMRETRWSEEGGEEERRPLISIQAADVMMPKGGSGRQRDALTGYCLVN